MFLLLWRMAWQGVICPQCALIAVGYSPYLFEYYQRVAARRGPGKAIIALARKFLGVIYHTLKNNWAFEDFPRFIIKSA